MAQRRIGLIGYGDVSVVHIGAIEAIDVWAEGVLVGGQRGSGDDLARQAIEARLGVVL